MSLHTYIYIWRFWDHFSHFSPFSIWTATPRCRASQDLDPWPSFDHRTSHRCGWWWVVVVLGMWAPRVPLETNRCGEKMWDKTGENRCGIAFGLVSKSMNYGLWMFMTLPHIVVMVYQASQRIGYIFACDYICVLWCVQNVMLRICELCSAEVWVMRGDLMGETWW